RSSYHPADAGETPSRVDAQGSCLARSFRRQLLDRPAQAGDGAIRGTGFERWGHGQLLRFEWLWCCQITPRLGMAELQSSLTGHLNRGVNGFFEIVRVVGRGL